MTHPLALARQYAEQEADTSTCRQLRRAVADAVQRLHDEATAQAVMHQPGAASAYTNAANIVQRALNAHPQAEPARYTREEVLAFGEAVRQRALMLGGVGRCSCQCAPCGHDDFGEELRGVLLTALLDATVKR